MGVDGGGVRGGGGGGGGGWWWLWVVVVVVVVMVVAMCPTPSSLRGDHGAKTERLSPHSAPGPSGHTRRAPQKANPGCPAYQQLSDHFRCVFYFATGGITGRAAADRRRMYSTAKGWTGLFEMPGDTQAGRVGEDELRGQPRVPRPST